MSDAPTDILIFGAGFGTRMAPLTDTMPKPMVPVAGRPLINHAIGLCEGLNIHVNAHYRADQLVAHLPNRITTHVEHPDILDTGGGLKAALPTMSGETVLTLNSDAVWKGPNPLDVLIAAWKPNMDALLLLVPIAQTIGFSRGGDFSLDQDGHLIRSPDGQVYTGAQIVRRDAVLNIQDEVFSFNVVWNTLSEKGTIFGVGYQGTWADVGTPKGIPLAEAMLGV